MESVVSHHKITPWQAIIMFILMGLFLCFEMALQVSPSVMTVELSRDLQLNALGLGLFSGVYFITYMVMQIPSGLLYDRTHFRRLVTLTIVVCAISAGLLSIAHNLPVGLLARLLMGFGSAFAFLAVLIVAVRYFKRRYFAMLTGIAQLLAALGAIGGGLPIAWLVQRVGWRDTMLVLAALGLVLATVVWFFLKRAYIGRHVEIKTEKVGHSLKIIAKNRQTWIVGLYAFCNWLPMTAFASLWGVPYLKTAYQLSTITAASLMAFVWLGIGLVSPFVGALSDLIGRRNPVLLLTALIGCMSMSLILYFPHFPIWLLAILLFTVGIGSSGQIVSFAVIRDQNAHDRVSTAISFNNMAVVASGFVAQPLVGNLLNWVSSAHGDQIHFTIGEYQRALTILPLAFAICVVLGWRGIKESLLKIDHS